MKLSLFGLSICLLLVVFETLALPASRPEEDHDHEPGCEHEASSAAPPPTTMKPKPKPKAAPPKPKPKPAAPKPTPKPTTKAPTTTMKAPTTTPSTTSTSTTAPVVEMVNKTEGNSTSNEEMPSAREGKALQVDEKVAYAHIGPVSSEKKPESAKLTDGMGNKTMSSTPAPGGNGTTPSGGKKGGSSMEKANLLSLTFLLTLPFLLNNFKS